MKRNRLALRSFDRRNRLRSSGLVHEELTTEAGDPPILRLVTICLVFGTLAVTFLEYRSFQHSEQARQSLQLVEDWEDDGYRESISRISEKILSLEFAAKQRATAMGLDANDALTANFVTNALSDDYSDVEADLDRLIYFFEKLALCVREQICDRDLLVSFFAPTMKNLSRYFPQYLEDRRARNAEFAINLQNMLVDLE